MQIQKKKTPLPTLVEPSEGFDEETNEDVMEMTRGETRERAREHAPPTLTLPMRR